MSELFRSQDMDYVAITMTAETSHATIAAIGKLSLFHQIDISPSAHAMLDHATSSSSSASDPPSPNSVSIAQSKWYKRRLAECIVWERKLSSIAELRLGYPSIPSIPIAAAGDAIKPSAIRCADLLEEATSFFAQFESQYVFGAQFQADNARELQALIERRWVVALLAGLDLNSEIAMLEVAADAERRRQDADAQPGAPKHQSNNSNSGIGRDYLDVEMIGTKARSSSGADANSPPSPMSSASRPRPPPALGERFHNFVCGTIPIEGQPTLTRLLYRLSRGNALIRFADIDCDLLDANGNKCKKSVFYVIYLGSHLESRVIKLCEITGATLYKLPDADELGEAVLEQQKSDVNANASSALVPGAAALAASHPYAAELAILDRAIVEKRSIRSTTFMSQQACLLQLFRSTTPEGDETCPLLNWQTALHEEKILCDVFMKAHYYLTLVAVEGWVPRIHLPEIHVAVREAVAGLGVPAAMIEVNPEVALQRDRGVPPTRFPLNKFTSTFQGIVDTYGVPRYKEVNPGLFTIITFPFLFGIMYGDIGHGVIITIAAILMIYYEQVFLRQKARGELNEIIGMAFAGRYVLLLMGMFAVYAGSIYNDAFSVSLSIYPSGYMLVPGTTTNEYQLASRPYPYGLDYAWQDKENELAFFNSFKMKMAVVIGVIQMIFGIILSACNHIYFNDKVSTYFEFIPRMIFLLAIFGYMDFMIIYKWCIDWSNPLNGRPPNLIQVMIAMFLSPGTVDAEHLLYPNQGIVQVILVLAAVFSVPVMLCVKPCWLNHVHKKALAEAEHGTGGKLVDPSDGLVDIPIVVDATSLDEVVPSVIDNRSASPPLNRYGSMNPEEQKAPDDISELTPPPRAAAAGAHGAHGEFNFSDEIIHQSIHTIEFVLGTVSNTASYLRLWALSLAHQQLSTVFWTKMFLQYGIANDNSAFSFIGYAIWAVATFAVLLCMDVLECFLHALRLHWVEFQNKFYFTFTENRERWRYRYARY